MTHFIAKCRDCGSVLGECHCDAVEKPVTYTRCEACEWARIPDLSLGDIQARVEKIAEVNDPEAGHSGEDELHQDLLWALAKYGPPEWAERAKAALKTTEMPFTRYYS